MQRGLGPQTTQINSDLYPGGLYVEYIHSKRRYNLGARSAELVLE